MNNYLKYIVRLITDEQQLTEALALRYKTYKKTFPKVIENLSEQFETDAYDPRSIHLGLFCEDNNGKRLAGYCRLIIPIEFEEKFSEIIVKQHFKFASTLGSNDVLEKVPLIGFLSNENHKTIINSLCNSYESQNEIYAEVSRFIIDEDHRSLSLSSFFVSGMIAVCRSLQIRNTFFTCDPHHVSFYQRLGLEMLAGIDEFETECFGYRRVIFGCDLSISKNLNPSIEDYKNQIINDQQICFNTVYRKAA